MKKTLYFLPFLTLLALASCKHEAIDNLPPVANITQPLNMSTYHNGDTLFVQGTVSDNDDLHEMYVGLHTPSDTLFSATPDVHGLSSYTLDSLWVVTGISANTNAVFQLIVADHNENVDTTNLYLTLMP